MNDEVRSFSSAVEVKGKSAEDRVTLTLEWKGRASTEISLNLET